MFKKFKNLFNKKTSSPISVKQNGLIKSEEYKKFTNNLCDTMDFNFREYMQEINSCLNITYPNYQKFLFSFSTNAIENLGKTRKEIINVSQNTFLAILSNYQQELAKCKCQSQKSNLSINFNKNFKAIIQEAETIFKNEFKKEFDNFKERVEKNLSSKITSKINDVKGRFKTWADKIRKLPADLNNKEQTARIIFAIKTLENESKYFGGENYTISKENRNLIKSIIYSATANNKRFKLGKSQKLNDSDKKLFQINDDKSLKFVIEMINFVVDDGCKESRIHLEEWIKKGCPTDPKKIYSN